MGTFDFRPAAPGLAGTLLAVLTLTTEPPSLLSQVVVATEGAAWIGDWSTAQDGVVSSVFEIVDDGRPDVALVPNSSRSR